jgi:hypothetical protein
VNGSPIAARAWYRWRVKKLVAGLAAAVLLVTLSSVTPTKPAGAIGAGPTSSDVAPIPRAAQYPPNTGLPRQAGTLDAANTYRQINFPTTASPYNYLEEQMQVTHESLASAGTSYFSPTQFYFDGGSNNGGYVGLQNQLYMPGNSGNVGKGVIFSIWGANNGTPAFCTVYCELVGGSEAGESFISVHVPYQWVQGHVYQFEVLRLPQSGITYVKASLYDLTTGAPAVGLGEIYVPGGWGGFTPKLIQWQEEYFPNSYTTCSAIPVYKSAYWSAAWFARAPGDNVAPFPTTIRYIDPNDGAHCQNSVSVDAGIWPAGCPDPVGGEAIGSTTY